MAAHQVKYDRERSSEETDTNRDNARNRDRGDRARNEKKDEKLWRRERSGLEGRDGRTNDNRNTKNQGRNETSQMQGPQWNEEIQRSERHYSDNSTREASGSRRDDGDHQRRRSRSRSREREGRNRDYDDRNDRNRDPDRSDNRRGGFDRRNRDREARDARKRGMYPHRLTEEDMAKVPSYINPHNVNVEKVIEQQEKRKLLWQSTKAKKETAPTDDKNAALWSSVSFAGDADGAVANKFKKLMGLKGDPAQASAPETEPGPSTSAPPAPAVQRQDELFRNLDRQYQMASLSAHTQRGVGLGFNSR